MKRTRLILAGVVAALGLIAWLGTADPIRYAPPNHEAVLPAADNGPGIIPGTEKRVTWFEDKQRTEWSVVYIPGFSATRQEVAPVAEQVATALGANLFETRLAGHGLESNALVGVTAEDWLDGTAEALAAGAALGDRIIVIATSTGATLATALLDHELMKPVDALVFLSPNFGLRDSAARRTTGPAGRILTRLLIGETRSWEPQNEAQARYWSTSYPSSALIEMVRALDLAETKLGGPTPQRWLMFYSEKDTVIHPAAVPAVMDMIEGRDEQLVEMDSAGDASHHILAGDIMSPATTDEVVTTIVEFIRRPVP